MGREPGDVADDPLMPMPAGKSAPCNRACRFAYPGEEAIYCAKHKMNGMVDVVNPSCKVLNLNLTHGDLSGWLVALFWYITPFVRISCVTMCDVGV